MKNIISLICFIVITGFTIGQDKKAAKYYFYDVQDFESAVDEYLELLKEDPHNTEYNYNIAISYLNSNIDKSLAIPYLEKLNKLEDLDMNVAYYLGRAYALGYQFDKAIMAFDGFIELAKEGSSLRKNAERQIEYCQNAKELMKFPLKVKFENLGKAVNSNDDDYFPFIPSDESFIVFNSNRSVDPTELAQSDILISYVKEGKYSKAKTLPESINTKTGREEIVGLNADGTEAILFFESFSNGGDLYECKIDGKTFGEPVKLDRNVNSKSIEIAACISSDNSRLYFASDRPGGYGGVDIYLCQRLPNGRWSEAQNLGPSVNTEYDEDFPNISSDGKVLYFSSKGHTSMGGYDIYKSKWDEFKKKFIGAKNLGFPINTPGDDMNFRVSENGKFGYLSALRKEGLGGLDIYRVTFQEVEPNYTALSGQIVAKDGKKKFNDLYIQIADAETGDVYGDYQPDDRTLRYVMILPPGEYIMYVEAEGYEMIEEEIQVFDKASFKNYLHNDIQLIPTK
jgi:hypothetical protein